MLGTSSPGLRSEGGFTLVELLIGLGIGTTIIWAVGAALVIGLRTTDEAGSQVEEAAWGQIVGNWFLSDVQSAEETGVNLNLCGEDIEDALGASSSDLGAVGSFTLGTNAVPPQEQHIGWWLAEVEAGDGTAFDVIRAECTEDALVGDFLVIAEGIQGLEIVCEDDPAEIAPDDALQCTIAWSTESDADVEDWPYRLTATRRTA